jgi:hypothetical protein
LLGDKGAVLYGKNHEVLLVDDRVLDANCLFALFCNSGVEVVQHPVDEFVLAKDQSLNAHGFE